VKLALQLILAMVTGILVALSAPTFLHIKRLLIFLDDDMRRSHVLIGSTLAVSFVEIWYSDGPERAGDLVRIADATRFRTHIGWLPRAESIERSALAPLDWSRLSAIEHHQSSLTGDLMHLKPSEHGRPHLVTHIPVNGPDGLLGALELVTSFETRDRHIDASIGSHVIALMVLSAVAAGLTLVWIIASIRRPLGRITREARRLCAAEPGEPMNLQHDKIGSLASEVNAERERLVVSNARAPEDTVCRVRLDRDLLHAERLTIANELAATVAHELGTPLNIVLGRAKMIVRGQVTGPAVAASAQSIVDQATRMTSVVRRLIEQTRRRDVPEEHVNSTTSSVDGVHLSGQVDTLRGVELSLPKTTRAQIPPASIR
jgi:hypothetical protein